MTDPAPAHPPRQAQKPARKRKGHLRTAKPARIKAPTAKPGLVAIHKG